jgi:subtilisin-like proprotein convertase family protein
VSIDSVATTGVGCSVPKGRTGIRPDASSVPVTFSFTGPAAAIADGLGAEVPGATLVVSLPVSGLATSITDVNFRFDGATCNTTIGSTTVGLDHTFVGDLNMVLRSPSGTDLTIVNRLSNGGGGNSGNNFCQTLLDDSGLVNIQTLLSASAPFTGTFLPANALSAFNGENPNGTWQLRITDFFVGDVGSVRAFSLVIDAGDPCSLTCPGDIVTTEDTPGSGMAVVTYPDPTETGTCQFVFCTPASGSSFPLGTTTVTCSESLGRGLPPFATCSFNVTVNPLAVCMLTCPGNVTTSNTAGQCGAVVNYPPPMATNCSPVTCTPPAGSFFPVGTTTVTCTEGAIPRELGGMSCSFTVTVNDTQPPTITCPANITVPGATVNGCALSAVVSYPAPTASDNCAVGSVVCSPASGSTFPEGTTTVTCTATDTSGNTATCSFSVTVNGAALFGVCVIDDLTGDTWSIVTDPMSPLYLTWRYRVALTGEVICGTANRFSFTPGRSLTASDNDDLRFFMDAIVDYSTNTSTVKVIDRQPRRRFVLRDRNLLNDPPCQ